MTRRQRLKILGACITCAATCLAGYLMIERGSVRPGVLLIAAGIVTAVVMTLKEVRSGRGA